MELCADIRECIQGEHPILSIVNRQHGVNVTAAWIVQQLFDLSEFCGCKEKLSRRMLEQTAKMIAGEFYYLKVTEVMLFMYRMKLGDYGKFYGSVDPIVILSSLRQFVKWRNEHIDRYEAEDRQRQREKWKKDAISRVEYERRKNNENEKPKD